MQYHNLRQAHIPREKEGLLKEVIYNDELKNLIEPDSSQTLSDIAQKWECHVA